MPYGKELCEKLLALCARYRHKVRFVKERPDRLRDFARSDIVIGMRSLGLVLDARLHKETVSILPASVRFPLPKAGITRLSCAEKLGNVHYFKRYATER